MEILEAFDLTGTLRGAAELAGCDHKTVAHWVRARDEAGGGLPVSVRARPRVDAFAEKVEEWVRRSRGKVRADVCHQRLVAMGYLGSERTTRRAVAEAKRRWRAEHGRRTRPWVVEPGLWMQWDYGDGPTIAGRRTVLFCAWLAWSRFRVVIALWEKTTASVVMALDRALRAFGGAPTYALFEYVARHIFVVLCPTGLCGLHERAARDHGDRRRCVAGGRHITVRATRASSTAFRRSARLGWCGIPPKRLEARSPGALAAWLSC